MALYLGNQKVSLRSGQDQTFDYGFDSNGRLVFANKNATEINNFLNYDSSYSEILDLSNLSKMEKVAVNGTADRKMEGLKGLLVSPNAPFTGSSPQINASYTGLSKSALVSLFESAPYNVGYEKVGNPTIVDGVASGFSTSNYLNLTSNIVSNFEISMSFTTSSQIYTQQILWGQDYSSGVQILANGSMKFSVNSNHSSGAEAVLTFVLSPNTGYKFIATKLGSILSLTLYNKSGGILDTSTGTYSNNVNVKSSIGFNPRLGIYPFLGSIDLNETYIKVNGVLWFTGKPAMTKTCSIIGATGTADLTQEDKNIILNKGWSLTVQ